MNNDPRSEEPQLLASLHDLQRRIAQVNERIEGHNNRVDSLAANLRGDRPSPATAKGTDVAASPGAVGSLIDTVERLEEMVCGLDTAVSWLEG